MAYGSPMFKCREAYQNRIYYPGQLSGKLDRSNDRYWQFDRQIKEMEKGRATICTMAKSHAGPLDCSGYTINRQ